MNEQKSLFPEFEDADISDMGSTTELKSKPSNSKDYVSSIWSFPGTGNDQVYRWYGTLPRPLLERLISLYTNVGETFVDAFLGTGISLDVAREARLISKGFDVNPLACLTAELRLFGVSAPLSMELIDGMKYQSKRLSNFDQIVAKLENDKRYAYTFKWFRPDTLRAVLTLLFRIAEIEDTHVQRLFFVAAAQTIRDVASVDPRCTHHLVTKEKPFLDPFPIWEKYVLKSLQFLPEAQKETPYTKVQQGSILDVSANEIQADLLLMHPPYLGVINYHLIHRLGTDLLDIVNRQASVTSLGKYNFEHDYIKRNDMSTDSTQQYEGFTEKVVDIASSVLSPEGRCVLIIGDQRHKGYLRHPFTHFIQAFEQRGLMLEENFIWILQNNGGMHVLRRGHFIDHNYILVFKR